MQKVSLADVASDPLATCNDGSPGIYYWAPAAESDARRPRSWLFLLGYGGWCWSTESCARRPYEMVSSRPYPETMDASHIFADDGPFGTFHRAWVPQCSSDAWMGDSGPGENGAGVNWRGARIMRVALQHLASAYGMADGDLLVFGGLSAGARGAMVHLDTLTLDGLVPAGVRLLGYLDSPNYVDMPPFGNLTAAENRVALQTQEAAAAMRSDAVLRGGAACALEPAWRCAFGEFRLPLLKTPFLLVMSQYDGYGLMTAEGAVMKPGGLLAGLFPEPPCELYDYADDFAELQRQVLTNLPQVRAGTAGLFSSTCYDHIVSLTPAWGSQRVNGLSHPEAVVQAILAVTGRNISVALGGPTRCAGSGATCAGNVCCPGTEETGNKTFPCPSADSQFRACEAATGPTRMPYAVSTCGELSCGLGCPEVAPSTCS